jgi:DNA-binding XRE family transcriptional regulator
MKTLKEVRKTIGDIRQEDLASKIGISIPTIINIENRKTQPQADVRKRIESFFQRRINWIKTCGLISVKRMAWEDSEGMLRKALLNINGLANDSEKKQFLSVAKEYITSIEMLLAEAKQPEKDLFLTDVDYSVLEQSRKHKNK